MPAEESGGHIPDRDRVVAGITGAIAEGDYAPGEKLPSIEQFAALYRTSKTTVKSALAILRDRGTIRSHPGKGTFVPDGTPDGPVPHTGGPTSQG